MRLYLYWMVSIEKYNTIDTRIIEKNTLRNDFKIII